MGEVKVTWLSYNHKMLFNSCLLIIFSICCSNYQSCNFPFTSTKLESIYSHKSFSFRLISSVHFCPSPRNLLPSTTCLLSSSVIIPKAFNVAQPTAAPTLSDTTHHDKFFQRNVIRCSVVLLGECRLKTNNVNGSDFHLYSGTSKYKFN